MTGGTGFQRLTILVRRNRIVGEKIVERQRQKGVVESPPRMPIESESGQSSGKVAVIVSRPKDC